MNDFFTARISSANVRNVRSAHAGISLKLATGAEFLEEVKNCF
jgi:hypothetical protein